VVKTKEPKHVPPAGGGIKRGSIRVDYSATRQAYIQGMRGEDGQWIMPSIRVLAKLHKISESSLRQVAARERWFDLRKRFADKLRATAEEKTIKKITDEASDFNVNSLKAAQAGVAECLRHFMRISRQRQLDPGAVYPERDLASLGRALDRFQRAGRLALGLPTDMAENNSTGYLEICGYTLPKPIDEMTPEEKVRAMREIRSRRLELIKGTGGLV